MTITKVKDSFNDYRFELSYAQLCAIHACLEKNHADPIRDELFGGLTWYIERLPRPGEEKDGVSDTLPQAQAKEVIGLIDEPGHEQDEPAKPSKKDDDESDEIDLERDLPEPKVA